MELGNIIVPMVGDLKADSLPSPEEYTYWCLRNNRIFVIDYEIDDDYSLIELGKIILQMNIEEKDIPKDDLKPIYILIHSFGGDSFQTSFFCDLLISSRIPIVTVAMGAVMSAGFEILIAGHKRFSFRHTQTLVHAGYASFQGTQSEIEEFQKNNKKQLDRTKDYVLSRTSIDAKLFNKNRNKDWYITGEDLVNYHVVDKIIENIEEIF